MKKTAFDKSIQPIVVINQVNFLPINRMQKVATTMKSFSLSFITLMSLFTTNKNRFFVVVQL